MTDLGKVDADTLDLTKPENRQVYLCCVVNLPFRLRLGDSYAFPKSDNEDFKLHFKNPYKIPPGGIDTEILVKQASKHGTYNFFWTKVLIVLKKQQNQSWALAVLNDFIIAYATVCKSTHGFLGQVKTLTDMEFSEAAESEIEYHCPKDYVLTDLDIEKLINWKPPFLGQVSGFPLFKFKDLPTQAIDKIPVAFDRHRNYVFYEFAFYAKFRMQSLDYIGALLMACVALEGAHGAFLRHVRENGLSTCERKKERNFKRELKKVPRGSQFYERIKTTVFIFIKGEEKPPDELLAKCGEAIEIRDDIMHAIYSEGAYKLREHETSKLVSACRAIMDTYKYFLKALEKRQEQNYS